MLAATIDEVLDFVEKPGNRAGYDTLAIPETLDRPTAAFTRGLYYAAIISFPFWALVVLTVYLLA